MAKPKTGPASPASTAPTSGDVGNGPPIDHHDERQREVLRRFDPFTATMEDIKALPIELQLGHRGATQKWLAAQDIQRRRGHFEAVGVMEGMRTCLLQDITPPPWLLHAFLDRHERALQQNSWDAAFGAPLPPRASIATMRLRELKRWELLFYFARPDAPPRNREGFAKAAADVGITTHQAEEWTEKTRTNRRGHRPYGPAAPVVDSALMADPFGRSQRPPKNRKKR